MPSTSLKSGVSSPTTGSPRTNQQMRGPANTNITSSSPRGLQLASSPAATMHNNNSSSNTNHIINNNRGVAMDVIEKSMGRVRKRRGESMESCCLRITHLRLQSKKLSYGLDAVVRLCPGLKVLYAYDNYFRDACISHKVEHVFLQDNLLTNLSFLRDANSLKYLNVANNCIRELYWQDKGPDEPPKIEKINISGQRSPHINTNFYTNYINLPTSTSSTSSTTGAVLVQHGGTTSTTTAPGGATTAASPLGGGVVVGGGGKMTPDESMSISNNMDIVVDNRSTTREDDINNVINHNVVVAGASGANNIKDIHGGPTLILRPDFLPKLAGCLKELCIADNRLRTLNVLHLLPLLTVVDAENNLVSKFGDLEQFVSSCDNLNTLKITGNPLCTGQSLHVWRDPIICACQSIDVLNDKEVTQNEKLFVVELVARKRKAGRL